MWHLSVQRLGVRPARCRAGACTRGGIAVLGLATAAVLLAACGATTSGQTQRATPPAPPTVAPTPTATPSPTPTPTPTPTATPQPAPTAPPILDVRPASMSLVGHLDCTKGTAYSCAALVLSRSSNQGSLHWSAATNVPGQISFSPASGVLAPGQSTLITITVPLNDCTPGLFFFHGPANTHTISWAC